MDAFTPPPPSGLESPEPSSRTRRRYPLLFWVLLVLSVLLLAVGLSSLVTYSILSSRTTVISPDAAAWDQIDPQRISSGLAVWTLTGIGPAQVYRQAMSLNELETAAMTCLTVPTLTDQQRIGWLAVLARRQAEAGDTARSRAYNRWVTTLIYLAPTLSDWQRIQALQEVAATWIALDDTPLAEQALSQLGDGVQNSPELSLAVRRQMMQQIATKYQQLGLTQQARVVAAQGVSALAPVSTTLPTVDPLNWLQLALPADDDVQRFHAARVAEAQRYVDSWIADQGTVSRSQIQALAGALLDEDIARRVYYERYLGQEALGDDRRLALLWDQVQWLVLKHEVASQLSGQRLVPSWEAELPAIRQTLHDAFGELIATMLRRIDTLPADEQPAAQAIVYRQALMWATLGLYPDADTVFLANALSEAISQLPPTGGLRLQVGLDAEKHLQLSWGSGE